VKDRLKILDIDQFTERVSDELVRSKRYERALTLCAIKLDETANAAANKNDAADAMSTHIRAIIRDVDIQCRYSEDTVVICLPETNPSCAQFVARRVAQSLTNFQSNNEEFCLSVKASLRAGDTENADELISSLVQFLSDGD
jgi:GGDEF domain-containing protein